MEKILDLKAKSMMLLATVLSLLNTVSKEKEVKEIIDKVCDGMIFLQKLLDLELDLKKATFSNPFSKETVERLNEQCNNTALDLRNIYKSLEIYKEAFDFLPHVLKELMERLEKDYRVLFEIEDRKNDFEKRMQ